jgi:hypothetical protein
MPHISENNFSAWLHEQSFIGGSNISGSCTKETQKKVQLFSSKR